MREAGNKLLRKGDQKSKSAYALLFLEGMEKSYRVPVKDRPSQVLDRGPTVKTSDLPSNERNGTVILSVEHRADGTIGELRVLNGLGPKIDQRFIQAAQSIIFLPAVRDREFVTELQTAKYKISWAHP